MSNAYYPLGMKPAMSSGYTQHSTHLNKQYISWKGTGINANPVGSVAGNIRPFTNNDVGNIFPTGFGLPRPIKHFRKGRNMKHHYSYTDFNLDDTNSSRINIAQINYNANRYVKTSSATVSDILDKPGTYTVKDNGLIAGENNNINSLCNTCESVKTVVNYYPNETYLTNNPPENMRGFCCNQERKAKRRTMYASTNLNKNYYNSSKQYLQNRCKTYEQKVFNFAKKIEVPFAKPGGPLSYSNEYIANCYQQMDESSQFAFVNNVLDALMTEGIVTPEEVNSFYEQYEMTVDDLFNWIQTLSQENGEKEKAIELFNTYLMNPYWGMPPSGPKHYNGCKVTVYKPSNYKFAKQGAVTNSLRMLALKVNTISTNSASIQNNNNTGEFLVNAEQISKGIDNQVSNLYKLKFNSSCSQTPPLNFHQFGRFQNKHWCPSSKLSM
jgi:hypothetical protein